MSTTFILVISQFEKVLLGMSHKVLCLTQSYVTLLETWHPLYQQSSKIIVVELINLYNSI
jgi:hypothetical protein